jgi:hypothetical protein
MAIRTASGKAERVRHLPFASTTPDVPSSGRSALTWFGIGLSLLLTFGLIGYVVDLRGLAVLLAVVLTVAVVAGVADRAQYRRRLERGRATLRAPWGH